MSTPLTVDQLIGRLDIKCDQIMMLPRPNKGEVAALVGLCRRLVAALEERNRNDKTGL